MNMKIVFILLTVFSNLYASEVKESKESTIIIINPKEKTLNIQFRITPEFSLGFYSTRKKYDTIHIESTTSSGIVMGWLNQENKYTYNTFLINHGEKVVLEWGNNGLAAVTTDKIRKNELDFFPEMQKSLGNFEGTLTYIPHKRKNADSLLNTVLDLYSKRLYFLEEYKITHPVSEEYESQLRKILKYRQYYDFLDHCQIDGILNMELLLNPGAKSFIDSLLSLKDDENIYLQEALAFALKLEEGTYTSVYSKIKSAYTGSTRDFLLYKTISRAYSSLELGELVDDYLSTAESEVLKKYVADEYGDYGGSGLEFTKPTYNFSKESLLYNLKTKEFVSWDTLLKSGGIGYIDFWATWCGGCRLNLPYTRKLANEMSSGGGRVIYISKDKNVKAWAKISRKEQLPDEDSYLLLDADVTLISQKYHISAIPRYMIVDRTGKISNDSAPHPNSSLLHKELIKAAR